MIYPTPFGVRVAFAVVAMAGLIFGGYRMVRSVGHYSGATSQYVADNQTGCAYPELYVTKKNKKLNGEFIPVTRQVRFTSRSEALKAGYKQCQN